MKSEKGITLTSLVVYVVVATVVISIMAVISSFFFSNMTLINGQEQYALEFNKFNMFFINDVKNNKNAQIDTGRVVFEDGTIYEYRASEKAIYRNNIKIAKEIEEIGFIESTYQVPNTQTTKNLVNVKMTIGKDNKFSKTIEYVFKYC